MRPLAIRRLAVSTASEACCPGCGVESGENARAAPGEKRAGQLRQALRLQYLTSGYNIVEGIVAVSAGLAATSVALLGFGFDSGIEVASSAVIIWRFRHESTGRPDTPGAEKRASRAIAVTFLALAAYVGFAAVRSLLAGEAPSASMVGIALAVASLIVMPTLTVFKRRLARAMHSGAALAESNQTLACTVLSGLLLFGLAANAVAGWWWADSAAALLMVPLLVREGMRAWKGVLCCDLPSAHQRKEHPKPAADRSQPLALVLAACAFCACADCVDGCLHRALDGCGCRCCAPALPARSGIASG